MWKPRADPGSAGRTGRTTARKSVALVVRGVASQLRPDWLGGFEQEQWFSWDSGIRGS